MGMAWRGHDLTLLLRTPSTNSENRNKPWGLCTNINSIFIYFCYIFDIVLGENVFSTMHTKIFTVNTMIWGRKHWLSKNESESLNMRVIHNNILFETLSKFIVIETSVMGKVHCAPQNDEPVDTSQRTYLPYHHIFWWYLVIWTIYMWIWTICHAHIKY